MYVWRDYRHQAETDMATNLMSKDRTQVEGWRNDMSGTWLETYPAPPVMMQFLPSRRPMLNDRALDVSSKRFEACNGVSLVAEGEAMSYIKSGKYD
jgi:hypothetical protein